MPEVNNLGHIDRALTNISVAYMQGADAFIADKVFPIVNVTRRSDTYFEYDKGDMFRDEVQERGRGAESAGGEWNLKEADPYLCRRYAYHYDITEEEKVNYDKPLDIERDTTEWLTHKMLLRRELHFTDKFFKQGVWGKDIVVDGTIIKKWDNPQSDPIKMVNDIMLEQAENTGLRPNFAIMSPDVFYALKNHDVIMDRIKYTQKGIVTADLIASLFEVDKIYIPWGISNTGPQTPGYDEAETDMSFLYKGRLLLGHRTLRPSLKRATAGYIFAWTGLMQNAFGSRIVRIKMDQLGLGTERLEMEMAYDMKVISKDLGTFVDGLV